jgi:hypothetical protein
MRVQTSIYSALKLLLVVLNGCRSQIFVCFAMSLGAQFMTGFCHICIFRFKQWTEAGSLGERYLQQFSGNARTSRP